MQVRNGFRRAGCALSIGLAAISISASAGADTPTAVEPSLANSDARTEAQAHFRRGIALAQNANDWSGALQEFLRSREIYPSRSATQNAAIVLVRLGRYAEAADLYASYLADFPSPLDPDKARGIARDRDAALAHVGEIEVRGFEANAHVVVDGVQRAVTPLTTTLRLDPGHHVIRISKDGYLPFETDVATRAGERRVLQGALKKAAKTGTLSVFEATGKSLSVVVDSAVLGPTPWRGELSVGHHLVVLRGAGTWGTPPSATEVKAEQTTSLTLRAVELDATLHVDPTPSSAAVYVDDILVGNGVWEGRLPSGFHRIDAVAPGHLRFRQELRLAPGQSLNVKAPLERDVANPLWRVATKIPLQFELFAGAFIGASLGGGADRGCGCRDRSRPNGWLFGGRIGYRLLPRFSVELGAGYLVFSESMTRAVVASGEIQSPRYTASDYRDSTRLSGPLAAFSISYRSLTKLPVTTRLGVGVAHVTSKTTNAGTFAGEVSNPGESKAISLPVSIQEAEQRFWAPFVSSEVRVGYRFNAVWSADLGAALMLFFPERVARGGTDTAGAADRRGALLSTGEQWADGRSVIPGRLTLPREEVAGPFIGLAPSVAVQARF